MTMYLLIVACLVAAFTYCMIWLWKKGKPEGRR